MFNSFWERGEFVLVCFSVCFIFLFLHDMSVNYFICVMYLVCRKQVQSLRPHSKTRSAGHMNVLYRKEYDALVKCLIFII